MDKKVFIVESEDYSIELLNFYMERELGVRVNNFFNIDELLMYLKLKPDIIIYNKNTISFEPHHIELLRERMDEMPDILALETNKIIHEKINDLGELEAVDEYKVNNIYFSVIDTSFSVLNGQVKNMQM